MLSNLIVTCESHVNEDGTIKTSMDVYSNRMVIHPNMKEDYREKLYENPMFSNPPIFVSEEEYKIMMSYSKAIENASLPETVNELEYQYTRYWDLIKERAKEEGKLYAEKKEKADKCGVKKSKSKEPSKKSLRRFRAFNRDKNRKGPIN